MDIQKLNELEFAEYDRQFFARLAEMSEDEKARLYFNAGKVLSRNGIDFVISPCDANPDLFVWTIKGERYRTSEVFHICYVLIELNRSLYNARNN